PQIIRNGGWPLMVSRRFRGDMRRRCDLHLDLGRVLRGRDSLFHESVPVVTVRTLPQELRAAVAAAHADVRVEIEDRVPRELAVSVDERCRMAKLAERAPDRLMNAEGVRILHEGGKQQIERVVLLTARGQVA